MSAGAIGRLAQTGSVASISDASISSARDSDQPITRRGPSWFDKHGVLAGGIAAAAGIGLVAAGAYRIVKPHLTTPLGVGLAIGGAVLALGGGGTAAAAAIRSDEDPGDELYWNVRLGQANMKNLFDLVDDPGKQDDVPTAEEHELHLSKLALQIRDVLVTPDVIALQEVENIEALEELANRPELAEFHYKPLLIDGRDPRGIDNAILYRSDRVKPVNVEVSDPKGESPSGRQTPIFTRPPLIASFVPVEAEDAEPVTVMVNHFTSRLQQKDGERRRLEQATHLAGLVDARLGADPTARVVVMGDLNDGPDHPPLQLLKGHSDAIDGQRLLDATLGVEDEERYTYRDGSHREQLDHALVTSELNDGITGVWIPHTNTTSTAPDRRDPTTPIGASDHDPLVVDMSLLVEPATQ